MDLHRDLFAGVWTWAGQFRRSGLNIGVDPHLIQTELHAGFGNLMYQWENTDLLSAHAFGIAVHAELVRIHPFTDGNGRVTRLLADLVYAAAQPGPHEFEYDWNVDKCAYIQCLRSYDLNRDPAPLAELVQSFRVR